MDEVNEFETKELLKNVSEMIDKRNFSQAKNLIQSKLQENHISYDFLPKVLSKLVLVTYCSRVRGENFFESFKFYVKEIPEVNEVWKFAKKEIIFDFLTIYKNLKNYLQLDYYLAISQIQMNLKMEMKTKQNLKKTHKKK